MNSFLIDTHAHLDFPAFEKDQDAVIKKALQNHVRKIINIGVNLGSSTKSIALAQKYSPIYATVAIHPSEIKVFNEHSTDEIRRKLTDLATSPKVVAIGECGLDYFRISADDKETREKQQELFELQIDLAKRLKLPLIIHSREAFSKVMQTLKNHQYPMNKVVFHSWSYNYKKAQLIIEKGGFIAFNAITTYPNAKDVQDTATKIDENRFFLETDCPFLPPQGKRGQRSESSHVIETATKIAQLRGSTLANIVRITTNNALNFFKL